MHDILALKDGQLTSVTSAGRTRLSKGEKETGCSSACPTGSRTFGNLTDPDNIVYKLVHQLEEQVWVIRPEDDTKPNIFYMKGNMRSVDNILNEQKFKYFDPNQS